MNVFIFSMYALFSLLINFYLPILLLSRNTLELSSSSSSSINEKNEDNNLFSQFISLFQSSTTTTTPSTSRYILNKQELNKLNSFQSSTSSVAGSIRNRSSTCLYYGFPGQPPVLGPTLILNGDNDLSSLIKQQPSSSSSSDVNDKDIEYPVTINNVCFPSQVSSVYAPPGQSLASVTIIGYNKQYTEAEVDGLVRRQLIEWWGEEAIQSWSLLKTFR